MPLLGHRVEADPEDLMTELLIRPDDLPAWLPGTPTVRSPEQGWKGVTVRGYRYGGSDVEVPPLRDHVVVAYRRGTTPMRRNIDGTWTADKVGPGDVSLLTRAVASHWVWSGDIDVVHVYLTGDEVATTCREMYDRDVADVALRDEVRVGDPAIHRTAMLIAREAACGGAGSGLLVDALACQLAVHILRGHADVAFSEPEAGGLTSSQERTVRDFVEENLHERISLDDLAAVVRLSRCRFARRFRRSTGTSPHEFVVDRRVLRAKTLLVRTAIPLPDVALRCGFADQSHLTRVFRARVGVTPGRFRALG
jgi:AraC family transcriptional regulator